MQKIISFEVKKGPRFAKDFVKEETDLTADMLATWVIIIYCGATGARLTD